MREKRRCYLARLNDIHPSLKFTMEKEVDGVLPFLDVKVIRQGHDFENYSLSQADVCRTLYKVG